MGETFWLMADCSADPAGVSSLSRFRRSRPAMAETYDLLITNGTCVLPWGQEQTNVGVRNGKIVALGAQGSAAEVIDAKGLHVLPGLIDPHVHLRDPGDATVESIPTGTKGALLGGLACVFDM